MDTYKLLVIVIGINLVAGFITTANMSNQTSELQTQLTSENTRIYTLEKDFESDENLELSKAAETDIQYEPTFGDNEGFGLNVFNVFKNSFGKVPYQDEDPLIEKILTETFNWLRALLVAFTIVEMYLLFVNRKS